MSHDKHLTKAEERKIKEICVYCDSVKLTTTWDPTKADKYYTICERCKMEILDTMRKLHVGEPIGDVNEYIKEEARRLLEKITNSDYYLPSEEIESIVATVKKIRPRPKIEYRRDPNDPTKEEAVPESIEDFYKWMAEAEEWWQNLGQKEKLAVLGYINYCLRCPNPDDRKRFCLCWSWVTNNPDDAVCVNFDGSHIPVKAVLSGNKAIHPLAIASIFADTIEEETTSEKILKSVENYIKTMKQKKEEEKKE